MEFMILLCVILTAVVSTISLLIIFRTGRVIHTQQQPQADTEQEYLDVIKKALSSDIPKLSRHCFNRLPSSFALLNKLWSVQEEQIKADIDPNYRRELVVDMNKAVALYRQLCNIADIDKADQILQELEKYSEEIMKALREKEEKNLSDILSQLRNFIDKLEKNTEDKAIVSEIEKIDSAIDKSRLPNYPDLSKEYEDLTKKLYEIFQSGANKDTSDSVREKQYNLQAVAQHKEALIKFDTDNAWYEKHYYQKGQMLDELVVLLGGWDFRHLYPATLSYTNNIYGYIFSKLKPEGQLKITEMMIKAEKKPI